MNRRHEPRKNLRRWAACCRAWQFTMAGWVVFLSAAGCETWLLAQEKLPPPPEPVPEGTPAVLEQMPAAVVAPPLVPGSPPTKSGITTGATIDSPQQDELQRMIDRLRKSRGSLRSRIGAAQQEVTGRGSSRRAEHPDVARIERDLYRQRQTTRQRAQQLKEKLDRLKQVLEQSPACTDSGQAPGDGGPGPPPAGPAPSPPEPPTPPVARTPDGQSGTPAAANAQAEPDQSPAAQSPAARLGPLLPVGDAQTSTNDNEEVPTAIVEALSVMDHAVDPLALANNLYGSGEYRLALDIYRKMDRKPLDQDSRLWIDYQIANCYRKLGKLPDAMKYYRIVTARSKESYWANDARWWLTVLDRVRRMRDRSSAIKQSLDQIQEALESDGSQDNTGST